MDAKGRFAVPTRVREDLLQQCGGRIVITANPTTDLTERCLLIYPEERWPEIQEAVAKLPSMNKASRRTQRYLIGYATFHELDGNGRVLLPPTLREFAGLDKKLMLVGQGKKFELWSEERWNAWMDDIEGDDDMPEALLNLTL